MKISVIVPVYNIEKYIKRCLDSIVHQSHEDLEIIVINDQSPDNSDKVIKTFLEDTRIKYVVNETNIGISNTREKAVKMVTSEHFLFVDGDDEIELNAIEELVKALKKKDYDLISFNVKVIDEDSNLLNEKFIGYTKELDDRTNMQLGFQFACNRLYRKSLFTSVEFPKGLIYEDLATMPKIIAKAKTVKLINKPFYKYRMRSGSITNSADKKAFDIYTVMRILYDFGMEEGNDVLPHEVELQIYLNLIFKFMSLRNVKGFKNRFDHMVMIKTCIKRFCPYKKRNKYYKTYMNHFVSGQKRLFIKLFNFPWFKHFIIIFAPKGKRF